MNRSRLLGLAAVTLATPACSGIFNPFAGVRRVVSLVYFVIAAAAVLDIVTSRRSSAWKVTWTLIVVLFPIVGLLAYIFAGRPN